MKIVSCTCLLIHILLLLILLAYSPIAGACISDLKQPIEPKHIKAYGIPANKLDTAFAKITVLTRDMFCDQVYYGELKTGIEGIQFRVDKDFNQDGKLDTAFVGTYRDIHGYTGIFVAVVQLLGKQSQKVLYVDKGRFEPVVSYLQLGDGYLNWPTCFYCDGFTVIEFGPAGFKESQEDDGD